MQDPTENRQGEWAPWINIIIIIIIIIITIIIIIIIKRVFVQKVVFHLNIDLHTDQTHFHMKRVAQGLVTIALQLNELTVYVN